MSAPIPLRRDFDASQLRSLARRTKDSPQARRLLAFAAIYDGATRTEAAKIGGVGLQIIRDWLALIAPAPRSAPPSASTPSRASKVARARQPSGNASTTNKSSFMACLLQLVCRIGR
jgi:hypothetical protein